MTNLNRLKALKSRFNSAQNNFTNIQRKARTRTLIQIGGLLNLVGLPRLCGINEGDDLQFDLENQDKAATLLGMLAHVNEKLLDSTHSLETNNGILEDFKQRGIRMMKDHEAKKLRY